jgi:hypothetical protein
MGLTKTTSPEFAQLVAGLVKASTKEQRAINAKEEVKYESRNQLDAGNSDSFGVVHGIPAGRP